MPFDATLTTEGRSAVIVLEGHLDADSDTEFRAKIQRALELDLAELVLDMSRLDQLSAAGLRTVAYARQQMSDDVQIIIASPAEHVRATLVAADFDDSVAIRE